jgi:hypothetical protein
LQTREAATTLERMAQASDFTCPSCGTHVADGVCRVCGAGAHDADDRARKLRVLSETVAELRRERTADAQRARVLERRFEALAAALARAATPPAS